MVEVKFQIVYECPDLDFQASYEKLLQSGLVTADTYEKGNLWVHFKKFKVLFVISPKGKIQVAFEEPKEKEILLDILKNLLVSKTGDEVVFHPLKQNLTIDYPAPKEIEIWWCEEKNSYVQQKKGEYQSIMDLPEAQEADWSKIPNDKFRDLNQLFAFYRMCLEEFGVKMDVYLDAIRSTLARYPKTFDGADRKENKSLWRRLVGSLTQ